MALGNWQRGDAITAQRLQEMVNAIRQNSTNIGNSGRLGADVGEGCLSVRVANNLGRDIELGEVVGLGKQLVTDNLLKRILDAEKIDEDKHKECFGIAGKKIVNGAVGFVHYMGICLAKINIKDADHKYAIVENDSTLLVSTASATSAKIIWQESEGTGEKFALVIIGSSGGGGDGYYVYNDTGAIIPKYSAIALKSYDEVSGVWTVGKPYTSNLSNIIFNDDLEIPVHEEGQSIFVKTKPFYKCNIIEGTYSPMSVLSTLGTRRDEYALTSGFNSARLLENWTEGKALIRPFAGSSIRYVGDFGVEEKSFNKSFNSSFDEKVLFEYAFPEPVYLDKTELFFTREIIINAHANDAEAHVVFALLDVEDNFIVKSDIFHINTGAPGDYGNGDCVLRNCGFNRYVFSNSTDMRAAKLQILATQGNVYSSLQISGSLSFYAQYDGITGAYITRAMVMVDPDNPL